MEDDSAFKADAEKFVRTALTHLGETPSKEKVRKAVGEIVKAFKPITALRNPDSADSRKHEK